MTQLALFRDRPATHDVAACWRMWIAGRALGLRLQGVPAVEASMRATFEAQRYQEEDAGERLSAATYDRRMNTATASADRYVVKKTGTVKRPFEVWDTKGGWVCFCTSKERNADERADELNENARAHEARQG